jgi:hypothetical protein
MGTMRLLPSYLADPKICYWEKLQSESLSN